MGNNTKRLLPRMRVNLTKRRRKKWPKNFGEKNPKSKPKKKKFLQKPGPKFFRTFSLSTRTHHYKKNCTVFFLATGIMILKHKRSTPPCLLFFSFAITRCFAKHFKYYYKYSLKLSIL